MSYDEDGVSSDDQGFKVDLGDDDELEPLEEGAINDFRFDEDTDDDPDSKYH